MSKIDQKFTLYIPRPKTDSNKLFACKCGRLNKHSSKVCAMCRVHNIVGYTLADVREEMSQEEIS